MQVVFCTDGIFPHSIGGMQRHSRLLIEELAKDIELEIVVIHPHKVNVFNSHRINEIVIENININNNYLLECYRYSKNVYTILLQYPNAIIYSQGLSVWYGIKNFSDRLIVNPHGLEPYQATGFKNKLISIIFRKIFNYIFKNSDSVISLGGRLTEILEKNVPAKVKIFEIPNAVNIPDFLPKPKYKTNVVNAFFLSRFAHNKGIDILFEAIEKLNSEGLADKFHFRLGGKGPLYDFYLKKNKCKNIELLGFVKDEDVNSLFEASDLFVFPTLYEGMPTVVLEAMSYGLPIIVSDVGATKVIVNHKNGKIIEAGSVESLVAALKWFCNLNEEKIIELSNSSILKVKQNYTWDIVAKMHKELFFKIK